MLAHRNLFILFLASSMALIAFTGLAQEKKWDQRLAEQKKERDATLGALSVSQYPLALGGYGHTFWLVDLSLRDRDTNAPFLYSVVNAALTIGRTYKAHMVNGEVRSIVINGVSVTMKEESWGKTSTTYVCDSRPSPEGGHWEPTANGYKCAPGVKETVKWKADKGSKQETARSQPNQNIPACHDYPAFHDIVLSVVISVKPAPNHTWNSEQLPSFIAGQILYDLNDNKRNITFKEASGELPNFLINVVVTETHEGTRQDTATVEVKGAPIWGISGRQDEVTLFTESSGDSPYISGTDAVYHLSINLLKWFEGGWHTNAPCLQPDGAVRNR